MIDLAGAAHAGDPGLVKRERNPGPTPRSRLLSLTPAGKNQSPWRCR